jgi:hypothetical protein
MEGKGNYSCCKTGRFLVYPNYRFEYPDQRIKEEVILTPNQQVVYNTVQENFSKKLVAEPQIILEREPTLFEMNTTYPWIRSFRFWKKITVSTSCLIAGTIGLQL